MNDTTAHYAAIPLNSLTDNWTLGVATTTLISQLSV